MLLFETYVHTYIHTKKALYGMVQNVKSIYLSFTSMHVKEQKVLEKPQGLSMKNLAKSNEIVLYVYAMLLPFKDIYMAEFRFMYKQNKLSSWKTSPEAS